MSVRDRLLAVFALLVACLAVGTFGYRLIEGWGWFDSLYMTVITIGTVGYGETHALSRHGRLFTMFLILGGIGVEVKLLKSASRPAAILRQLEMYAASGRIEALILVSNKAADLPAKVGGKPLHVVGLGRAWI